MTTLILGERFSHKNPWARQENFIIQSIKNQVDRKWPCSRNLIVLTTWFGPTFAQGTWKDIHAMIDSEQQYQNIFWLSTVDPLTCAVEQLHMIEKGLRAEKCYYLGTAFESPPFESPHRFNTGIIACDDDFPDFTLEQLMPVEFEYVYINYNRKPKPHRIRLVDLLCEAGLDSRGILTLGAKDVDYDVNEGMAIKRHLKIDDDPVTYTRNGYFTLFTDFGGVPCDASSLGRLDLWQRHFLNIVSETEFREWDNVFVSEKTWKPIYGMRPFVINGQVKTYDWLRKNGFRTFNQYWPFDIENCLDDQVQTAIVDLVKYLCDLPKSVLRDLYKQMMPDLLYNRDRFKKFAQEQRHKVSDLFGATA